MFRAQQCSKRVEEYNKLIIKQEFVHHVGQMLRLYGDARSAKHKKIHRTVCKKMSVNVNTGGQVGSSLNSLQCIFWFLIIYGLFYNASVV